MRQSAGQAIDDAGRFLDTWGTLAVKPYWIKSVAWRPRRLRIVTSMLIGMRDMTRGVMLPRWPWKIMHTLGESILPISGPKVSGGNWWPRFGRSTAFSPLFGENSLNHEDQEKYQVLRLMANALSISFSWWVAITLAILLTWVFEASFRRCGQWSLASHYP